TNPDLVILDLSMQRLSDDEIGRCVRSSAPPPTGRILGRPTRRPFGSATTLDEDVKDIIRRQRGEERLGRESRDRADGSIAGLWQVCRPHFVRTLGAFAMPSIQDKIWTNPAAKRPAT